MDFNIPNFDDLIEHPSSGLEQPNAMGNAHLLPHHQNMENPLRKIKFNEPIDKLVSQHLSQSAVSPFAPYEIKKDLSRVFYTSFFIGLLYNIFATPEHGIMAMYNRRTERKFQIAVAYGKTGEPNILHIHEIDFGTLSGQEPLPMQVSKEQLASLKANIERDFGGRLHISAVVIYEYTLYEQYTNVDMRVGVRMNLERSQRIDEKSLPNEYSLHDVDYSSYDNALSFLELWHEEWAEVVESIRAVSQTANNGPSKEELIALFFYMAHLMLPSVATNIHHDLQYGQGVRMMGFFYSIIFAALPDSYYERVMNSEYPPLQYNPQSCYIYLTSSTAMQHEHILINMQMGKLHTPAGYEVLAYMRRDRQEAKIYELFMEDNIELALNHDDGLARDRILRWDIHSVAESLHQDLLHLKDISTDAEMSEMYKELLNEKWLYYSGVIKDIIMHQQAGEKINSLSTLKSFLLGRLKTNHNIEASVAVGSADIMPAFHVQRADEFQYMMTFDQNLPDLPISNLLDIDYGNNWLCINFQMIDNELMVQVNYAPIVRTERFDHVPNSFLGPPIKRIFQLTSTSTLNAENRAVRQRFQLSLKKIFDGMREEYLPKMERIAYLQGALSNYDLQHFDLQNEGDKIFGIVQLAVGEQTVSFHVIHSNDETSDAAQIANQVPLSETEEHAFAIVSIEDGQFAIRALASNQHYLNTDNVISQCEERRKKRNMASICHSYDEKWSSEAEEKLNIEQLTEKVARKFPTLGEHISLLHDITGKLQLGFIARDMIGSIYQADWIGFARNAFFFGMSITLSNVGERLVAYGVGKKLAGNVLGGRFASSVGACLPKIGFDVYMGYQLFEDIKNNQTTSAAFTSTYLALDLLECGLETAAEFELITLSSTFLAGLGIVGFLTFLAMDITKSVMAVNKMDEIIPLTNAEKVFEGTLEFFNLGPNPILKKMAQEVTANEAIVFMALHHYPKVNRFLISEAQVNKDDTISFIHDNTIDLSKTYHFNKSRLMPREQIIGPNFTSFCSLSEEWNPDMEKLHSAVLKFDGALAYFAKRYTNPIIDYLCRNAFGIMRKGETEFPVTLFLLYNGTDSVTGFPTASNTFLLMNGEKMINGGSSNDQFLIQGENIFGYLNGSDGTDIVDFSAMGGTDIVLRIGDSEAYLSSMDQPAQYKLKLYSIEGVLGRRGLQDYISVCNETQIDLGGGLANDHDFIEISSSTCENKKLTIILNNYTFVGCSVDDITVHYQAVDQVGVSFQLDRGEHVFYIKMARIVETKFSIAPDFNMILFGTRGKLIMTIGEAAKVNFIFEQENIIAKIDDHNLTMYLVGKYDLFYIVENYAEYIKQNPHIKLLADTEQGVVILNHYSFAMKINNEIKMANLATNGHHTNMVLIGHRGVENYFQISSEADNFNDTLLNITIYPNLSENFTCFIDLHNLTLMIHQTTRGIYGLRMYPEKIEDKIKLKIFTSNNVDHMISERLIGEITIIDGFRYLDQITVHLYNNNNFVQHDDLSLIPETMHTNQTMVLISAGNFDFGAKIKFEYPASYLTSFKFEESLLITNVESMRGNATNYPISILLTDYFRYPNKFDSLMLIFENFVISGLNATVVKHAPSIKTMWLDMNQKLDNVDSGWDDDYEYDYDDEAENAYDDRSLIHNDLN